MNSVVQNHSVRDETPPSLATRIVAECYNVVTDGYAWIFLLSNGEKLVFFRLGDSLFRCWYENPLMQPMLWWLKPFGWPTPDPLSLTGLEEAISQQRFGAEMRDCCLHGPQRLPTQPCQKAIQRLDQLKQALDRAKTAFPQLWGM